MCQIHLFISPYPTELSVYLYVRMAYKSDHYDEALSRAVAAGAVVTIDPTGVTIQSNPPQDIRIAFRNGLDMLPQAVSIECQDVYSVFNFHLISHRC